MSEISERIMRGGYVSKGECFEHAEEIERTYNCYGAAMDAMEAAHKLPPCTRCEGEHGYADCNCDICGKPFCAHCLDRHEQNEPCTEPERRVNPL